MSEQLNQGALVDDRSDKEKEKDYQQKEAVVSVNPVNWKEIPIKLWRRFPIFNQDGSGSCVAQTLKKLLGIMHWLKYDYFLNFSANDIYRRRRNKPGSGMIGNDSLQICTQGISLEEIVPSEKMNDTQMDAVKIPDYNEKIRDVFKVKNYLTLPLDFDTVASTIQATGKGVMLWFYFDYSEWTDKPEVKKQIELNDSATCRHSIPGVEVTLYKGEEAIIIEDSWGPSFGLEGRRVITREFFEKRCFYAAYLIDFKFSEGVDPEENEDDGAKPKYHFDKKLYFSPTFNVNEDVKHLQTILKYEGMFPENIDCTGYYGSITCKAVYQWQLKHQVAGKPELDALQGRSCGPKTIAKLNELYA